MWNLVCTTTNCELNGQPQEVTGEWQCCAACGSIQQRP
jgi:hypothetical protein